MPPLARGSGLRPGHYTVNAWAIVNDETGRVMLIEVGTHDFAGIHRMEAPAIYMTKRAAFHHKRDDERIVRVAITEI